MMPFASSFFAPYNHFSTASYPYGFSMYGSVGMLGGYRGYGMNGMCSGVYGGMGLGPVGMYSQLGMLYDPMNPSVAQMLESMSATMFALLHLVVQMFAGLVQMLESMFMAMHSLFFTFSGIVDQFAQLCNT